MTEINSKEINNDIEQRVSYNTGYFNIINMCDFDLLDVTVRHTQKGVDNTSVNLPILEPINTAMNPKYIEYATGVGSGYDYWYVELTTSFGKLATKDNFYCSIASSDNGYVTIIIYPTMSVGVVFSSSSSCTVSLNKIS